MMVEVYAKAGYECASSTARQYKTVNRRLNASVGLFEKLTIETIGKWVDGHEEQKLIDAIVKGLGELKFDSMDDVLEYIGKPSTNRTEETTSTTTATTGAAAGAAAGKEGEGTKPPEGAGAGEQPKEPEKKPEFYKFNVAKVHVEIPQTMAAADMILLTSKILKIAREKEQVELKAAVTAAAAHGPVGTGTQQSLH